MKTDSPRAHIRTIALTPVKPRPEMVHAHPDPAGSPIIRAAAAARRAVLPNQHGLRREEGGRT
jgi:hypothetical protein